LNGSVISQTAQGALSAHNNGELRGIMSKEKQNIYWIKTGECFGGNGVGTDITEFLSDDLDKKGKITKGSRLEKLMEEGKVSFEKPLTPEVAEEQELNQLRATIQKQKEIISELEAEAKSKGKGSKKTDDLESEIVKKDVEIENLGVQIAELTKTIEDLTKPAGGE
jgi:predicted RNase H-like nuclease (RuvC/YqgF family)